MKRLVDNLLLRAEWLQVQMAQKPISKDSKTDALKALKVVRGDMRLKADGDEVGPPTSDLVLIFDLTFPDLTKDSGSDRIVRLARMSRSLGHRTVLASVAHRHWTEVNPDDTSKGALSPEPLAWTNEQFWDWVKEASVVWLSRPDVAGRLLPVLSDHSANRRIVFDTMDLYHVRLGRKAELTHSRVDRRSAKAYLRLERHSMRAADVTLVVTETERTQAVNLVPGSDVRVVPNVHETRESEVPDRSSRSGLIFYGNFRHSPNIDAVRVLFDSLMPAIWEKCPDTTLTIIGDRLPNELRSYPDPRVSIPGWVEDLMPYIDSAVGLIAPLRYGAGLKGKIGLAMANGLPVVTTPVGAEGMPLVDGSNCMIGTTDAELVAKTVDLLSDDSGWQTISRNSRDLIESTLSVSAVVPLLDSVLDLNR